MPQAAMRRGVVVEAGERHEVVHRRAQPGAQRRAVLPAPAEGEHLEAAAVVQFEQFGGEQAHRMHAEVARKVPHADAAGARRPAAVIRHVDGLRHPLVNEALGGHQLQRRVVGGAEHRQRRCAHHELVHRHFADRLVLRPLALLLPQVHVMLDHVRLVGLLAQAAAQERLGFVVAPLHFEQPGGIVDGMQAQLTGSRSGPGLIDHLPPLRQGLFHPPLLLELVAEVDTGLQEFGFQLERLPVGAFGLLGAAQRAEHGAPVEAGDVPVRGFRARDPMLVQLGGGFRQPRLVQALGAGQQVAELHAAGAGERDVALQGRLVEHGVAARSGLAGVNRMVHGPRIGMRHLDCGEDAPVPVGPTRGRFMHYSAPPPRA